MGWNVIFGHICLLCSIFVLHHYAVAIQCPEVASTVGTEFMFGVIGGPSSTSDQTLFIHITAMTDTPAIVRITSLFNNYYNQYTVTNYTTKRLSYTLIQTETGSQFKGIEINSDANISVAVFPAYGQYTEGFLVLPIAALSTRYVAASYHSYSYNNEILVAGVDSNSDVSINYSTNGKTYSTQKVRLQKFETYQLAVAHDISGAVITSNKPVAVFSGSAYSQIPVGIGDYEYIVEQMIPTKYWSNRYIVPPIYPHNYFIVKVFVDEDNTEIHYYNSTNHFAAYMNQGSNVEILFGSDPVVILANKPIYVVQYCADTENMKGNPFMAVSQGLSQYENTYRFVTQQYSDDNSTVAITIKQNKSSGLLLNGKTMAAWSAKSAPVAHPLEDYVTFFVNISYNSMYQLHHRDGIKFGATLYGLFSTAVAYGYPLQLSLSHAGCTHTVDNITSSPAYTITTTPRSTTHNSGQKQDYDIGNGTWCFECEDMLHAQYCDKVTKCRNESEVCFIQRYTRGQGLYLYRSGCLSKSTCQNAEDKDNCQQCCNGNFCNVVGCGDDDLPNFKERGPFCFDCAHKGANDVCQTVHMCRPDQVCKIDKYEWGSGFHYVMGCAEQLACKSKRDTHSLHARYAPVCSHCCRSDFCNMNCTSTQLPQIIG